MARLKYMEITGHLHYQPVSSFNPEVKNNNSIVQTCTLVNLQSFKFGQYNHLKI